MGMSIGSPDKFGRGVEAVSRGGGGGVGGLGGGGGGGWYECSRYRNVWMDDEDQDIIPDVCAGIKGFAGNFTEVQSRSF